MKPRINVIIPMYNACATVEETLRSVTAQTLTDWRALIVDDGSTDGSDEVVERVCETDTRIQMVRQANAGLSRARNTGIDAADGEYILFLDSDDVLYPEALESLVGAADATGLGGAYFGYEFLDADAQPIGRQTATTEDPVGIDELLEWNRFIVHSQIIRKDLLGDARFDATLTSGEDYDLWLRLAERGVRWTPVHRFGAGYRIRPGSMSKDFSKMAANESRIISSSFARMRTRTDAGTLDLSAMREHRALTHSALAYSTRDALGANTATIDGGTLVFEQWRRAHPVSASAAANAAVFAIQFGQARPPNIVLEEPGAWMGRLEEWWRRLAERGWTDTDDAPAFAARALAAMSTRLVHPRQVADAVLDAASPARRVIVLGNGARARWIGRAASSRGVRAMLVETLAHRWDDVGAGTVCTSDVGTIPREWSDAAVIVTGEPMSNGARAWAARAPAVIRWEVHAAALVADVNERLRRAHRGVLRH